MDAAKEWYIDGILKTVGAPSLNCYSFIYFYSMGKSIKQVPVPFALMSDASSSDYKTLWEHNINDVPVPHPSNTIMIFNVLPGVLFYPRSRVRAATFIVHRPFGVKCSHWD